MSKHINVNFITQFLMLRIIKMLPKYLLVKFDMNYLFYVIFKIPMISWTSLWALVRYSDFSLCFRLDPISRFGNFSLYFLTMVPEKLVLSPHRKLCLGFLTMVSETSLFPHRKRMCTLPWGEDAWRLRTARLLRLAWLGWGPSVNYRL